MEDESLRKSLWGRKEGRHECGPQDMTQEAGGPDMVQTSAVVGPKERELPPGKTALPAQNDPWEGSWVPSAAPLSARSTGWWRVHVSP